MGYTRVSFSLFGRHGKGGEEKQGATCITQKGKKSQNTGGLGSTLRIRCRKARLRIVPRGQGDGVVEQALTAAARTGHTIGMAERHGGQHGRSALATYMRDDVAPAIQAGNMA